MDSTFSEIQELNPANKGHEYAVKAVTFIRTNWKRYVDVARMNENKAYLFSQQSLEKLTNQYKDKGFLACTVFRNLGLLDSIVNTLVEEISKNPPKTELKATDSTAMSDRKKDLGLLKNRPIIQGDLTALQRQIGIDKPYKFTNPKYKSNIDEFDEMELDETDPDDVSFFKDYHRLHYEIAGQTLINNIMMTNRFDEETLRKMVIDILAIKKISMQVYVDKVTGQIKYKYIYPETAWGMFGDSYDGRDDSARGWEDNISVSEFLQFVGNDFEFDRDWKRLLGAINFSSPNKYTGFERRGVTVRCGGNELLEIGLPTDAKDVILSWSDGLRFKVPFGYLEFKTWEATSTLKIRDSDNAFIDFVPYDYDLEARGEVKEYRKESNYQQQWYSAYYLGTGANTQTVYNFSKVYYQQFEGANDEYSNGTLVYYREPGNSAVEMVKTDIEMIHSAYYKMLYMIYKAKPKESEYLMEELVALTAALKTNNVATSGTGVSKTTKSLFEDIIQLQETSSVRLRTLPVVDGKKMQQLPNLDGKPNGLDPIAGAMQAIVVWGIQTLNTKILGNGMRLGMNPPSRESNQSEQNSVDASKNSTGYIYRMIQYQKERAATITLMYAKDIINFEDSLPYKYLQNMLGESMFNGLSVLKEFADHRYGIFIRDYNTDLAKSDLRQAALISLQEKSISYADFFTITQTEDHKAASQKYALAKYKTEKKLRKQQIQDQQMQAQMQQQAFQNQMALLQFERGTVQMKQELENKALIAGKQIDAQSKISVKDMVINSEPAKQDAKSQAKQDELVTKANLEASRAYGD